MVEDKVLEKIKLKKLKEMLGLEASESVESLAQERAQHVTSKPVKVTDGTFMEVVRKNPLVVVGCWAPWCGPCHMVAPVVEELAKEKHWPWRIGGSCCLLERNIMTESLRRTD